MLMLSSPENVVPKSHPIRRLKALADEVLVDMSPTFDAMYAATGRHSIPPEQLLKASLLIALYSVRSERMFCEQLGYNLLFRWFLDHDMSKPAFDATVFTKNRERLLKHDVAAEFFARVVQIAKDEGLTSSEHFSVDGTLIEAWASLKSFRRSDAEKPASEGKNVEVDFHGEKRSNDTHESTTDPEAKLMRKAQGREAKLSYGATAVTENRNGLLLAIDIGDARQAEDVAAWITLEGLFPGSRRITVAGDKGYDTRFFVDALRGANVVPHVARKVRGSAIDARTTRHTTYAKSQRVRKRIEEVFGWMKTVGGFRRTRYRGRIRTQHAAHLIGATYNLLRIAKLMKPGVA